ncbi:MULTISPECIES: hypothetical protein [Streptomyces]|uniref:Phage or prophage related protein n=1 Tax=Streptomyces tsukubensis (strain DSM 42081 / NBRC 108919 / NRRL 18488 / 9993) TaxID=1114943 RepID=I2N843_STRT9|nr:MULTISPECIES: hypothetical protein [Streptomyces]AZK97086.1 hypothetical protein B7R87_26880 [Streptomyces tsukubensis]EIF93190.1 hypothetical protein [Streptomyces tsukubensis NRRL18488]MYS66467.1 hypothetical protein [Streptomyces sp. SID5473]QKM66943.1 hypothetical protein STSU_006890 [Streptomyces tsukubensis NRRL18488]TAI41580.1 hypothetical protein EWI31_27560 [Streptomyces tsukubensis]
MARIRTIKPEIWESEDIATVSVTALVTFVGLLTQADDEGRFRDHPAIIAGRIWALRQEHTPAHVAQDLEELATAGLICRYTGCDGRTYLHIVTWERHQKINRASESRLPRCSGHQGHRSCGRCEKGACPAPAGAPVHPTVAAAPAPPPATPVDDRPADREGAAIGPSVSLDPAPEPTGDQDPRPGKAAAQGTFVAGFSEDSRPGSRILDPGSSRRGRDAPAPDAAPEKVSAQELVAEYVKDCQQRPPGDVVGLLGRKIRGLLDEGFKPADIRAAMERLRAKGLHPSVLPSLVNEVVNPPALVGAGAPSAAFGGAPWASTAAYRPYFNPTTPEPTTFGGSL